MPTQSCFPAMCDLRIWRMSDRESDSKCGFCCVLLSVRHFFWSYISVSMLMAIGLLHICHIQSGIDELRACVCCSNPSLIRILVGECACDSLRIIPRNIMAHERFLHKITCNSVYTLFQQIRCPQYGLPRCCTATMRSNSGIWHNFVHWNWRKLEPLHAYNMHIWWSYCVLLHWWEIGVVHGPCKTAKTNQSY